MPDIMKMGKESNYLGSWDLYELPNREVTLTISKIIDEEVISNGRKEICTVFYWSDSNFKPMIVNLTNKKRISKLYQTKETERLKGKSITVVIEQVRGRDGICDALRFKQQIPKANNKKIMCDCCGGEIKSTAKMDSATLSEYTFKTFGTHLCAKCATNATNEAKKAKDAKDSDTE